MIEDVITEKLLHELNEEHFSTSLDTPMREDAFKLKFFYPKDF